VAIKIQMIVYIAIVFNVEQTSANLYLVYKLVVIILELIHTFIKQALGSCHIPLSFAGKRHFDFQPIRTLQIVM
jgi:hypothetical protein